MNSQQNIIKLKASIKDEISLFGNFLKLENSLNESVKSKNWEKVNKLLANLSDISVKVEKTEKKRHKTYIDLCGEYKIKTDMSFKSFIDHVPAKEKDDLNKLQKELAQTTKKVKKISIGMSSHFKYMCETINQLLEEIFPYRKGKIYSRQGKASEASSDPVVINKRL